MDKQEAKAKFEEADRLYQAGQFENALQTLDELDRAFPDERRVQFPKARCLAKLGRFDEARTLASQIVLEHGYTPARKLMEHLDRRAAAPAESHAPDSFSHLPKDLESILDGPKSFGSGGAPPPIPAAQTAPDWVKPAAAVAIIVIVLVAGAFGQARWGDAFDEWMEQAETSDGTVGGPPLGGVLFTILFYLPVGLATSSLAGYVSLLVVKRLPYDDFWDNMKDILLYVVYCTLLAFVPLIGWVLIPYILYKHYETSFFDLVVMAIMYILVSGVLQVAVGFVIGLGSVAFS